MAKSRKQPSQLELRILSDVKAGSAAEPKVTGSNPSAASRTESSVAASGKDWELYRSIADNYFKSRK